MPTTVQVGRPPRTACPSGQVGPGARWCEPPQLFQSPETGALPVEVGSPTRAASSWPGCGRQRPVPPGLLGSDPQKTTLDPSTLDSSSARRPGSRTTSPSHLDREVGAAQRHGLGEPSRRGVPRCPVSPKLAASAVRRKVSARRGEGHAQACSFRSVARTRAHPPSRSGPRSRGSGYGRRRNESQDPRATVRLLDVAPRLPRVRLFGDAPREAAPSGVGAPGRVNQFKAFAPRTGRKAIRLEFGSHHSSSACRRAAGFAGRRGRIEPRAEQGVLRRSPRPNAGATEARVGDPGTGAQAHGSIGRFLGGNVEIAQRTRRRSKALRSRTRKRGI